MENHEMKTCPYCAEQIRKQAIKCRYCGSALDKKDFSLNLSTPGYWHRVNKGKKVAGVCTGLAQQLDSPILILPLRLFFILTTLFYGFGVLVYILLWILMPAAVDKTETSDAGARAGKGPIITPPPPPEQPRETSWAPVENDMPEPPAVNLDDIQVPADSGNADSPDGNNEITDHSKYMPRDDSDDSEPPSAQAGGQAGTVSAPVADAGNDNAVSDAGNSDSAEDSVRQPADTADFGSENSTGKKGGEWKVEMSSKPGFMLSAGTMLMLSAVLYAFVLDVFLGFDISSETMLAFLGAALLPVLGLIAAKHGVRRAVSGTGTA